MSLSCAVTITTRNRKDDLARTCEALVRLNPAPDEVLICADGCTDGTIELIQRDYPAFQLRVNEHPKGSIPSRHALIQMASSDLILSIDDDSYPVETDFLTCLKALFTENPKAAVITFPQRSDEFPKSLHATDFGPRQYLGTYSNAGAAIRRSSYLATNGYPAFFGHAYEEPDFALQCAAAGWFVLYEPSLTIRHHYTGVQRNEQRTHQFHARNELNSVVLRCPALYLLPVGIFRIIRQFGYAWSRGMSWVLSEPRWWITFLKTLPTALKSRRPIPWKKYRAWMKLLRHPLSTEADWRSAFE